VHNTCKGNWAEGSFDSPRQSEEYHYNKHGFEVGASDIDDYTRRATNYANTVLDKKIKGNLVSGFTENVYQYKYNNNYIRLLFEEGEHLIVSFGRQ